MLCFADSSTDYTVIIIVALVVPIVLIPLLVVIFITVRKRLCPRFLLYNHETMKHVQQSSKDQ